MRYRSIADGKLEVSAICLGCWSMAGGTVWGDQKKADALAAIHTSLDSGVNFFDSAEGYAAGYSEQLLGEGLAGRRDEAIVATKVSRRHLSAADLPGACEDSLKNLGTDRIDVYHIHWPSREVPFDETVRALERLVDAGKVRHIAVSNFGAVDLTAILPLAFPVADQLAYNLLFRAIEFEILPACVAGGVPVTCYSPMMQGMLTGKFTSAEDVPAGRQRSRHFSGSREMARHGEGGAEGATFDAIGAIGRVAAEAGLDMGAMSLAWLLGRDGGCSAIVGARNAEQATANAAAAEVDLPADVARKLTEITDPLKQALGSNPDMWQHDPRIR